MVDAPSEPVTRAWTGLLRAHTHTLRQVEAALKAAGLPPLAWYDALLELDRVGKTGLRPIALEQHLLLPQYGLSRLLDRIVRAGYVERRPVPGDGRGQLLVITRAGRGLRKRMWRVYAKAINAAVGTHLSDRQAAILAGLLARLKA